MTRKSLLLEITAAAFLTACYSGTNGGEPDGAFTSLPSAYTFVPTSESGALLTATGDPGGPAAVPGDAVGLAVDIGTDTPLASTATVSWYGQPVLTAVTEAPGPGFPVFGNVPTAILLQGGRSDLPASAANMLFVLDQGTGLDAIGNSFPISINAQVTDNTLNNGHPLPWDAGGLVPGEVDTAPPLVGDPDAGGTLFAASCAACHAAGGEGVPSIDGGLAAPGLNAESGNLAADPSWTQGLFVFSTLVGVDNTGVVLQLPMPLYLGATNPLTAQPFTNQDLSNVYAWLLTQICIPAGDPSLAGDGSDCCSAAIDANGDCTSGPTP